MSRRTSIEWTNRTWNPTRGCTRVSEGCRNCYAERQAIRQSQPGRAYHGLVKSTKAGPRWTGEVALVYENLGDPLSWREPSLVFVDSMSDLFHEKVPDGFIDRVFGVMAIASEHTFQVLTKRPERAREYFAAGEWALSGRWAYAACEEWHKLHPTLTHEEVGEAMKLRNPGWPLPNVWLGTSVENQAAADERIPHLLATPAAVRFLSCEPLLGPLELRDDWFSVGVQDCGHTACDCGADFTASPGIDWVICGGESGPRARPLDVHWAMDLRAQCGFAGVPFFMKQLGSQPGFKLADEEARGNPAPSYHHYDEASGLFIKRLGDRKGGSMCEWPEELRVREMPGQVVE